MAKKGWHLKDVSFAMMIFELKKDEPKNIRYALDYNNKVDDEYMMIAEDAGWKYIAKSTGWILFSKKYDSERPELFSDNQSIIDRNKRLLRFLSVMAALQIPILTMNFIDRDYSDHFFTSIVILCIYLPMVVLLFLGVIKLFFINRSLIKVGRR